MDGLIKKLVVEKGLNTTVDRVPLKGLAAFNLPYKLGFRHVLSINFMMMSFFVPLIMWIIYAYLNQQTINSIMPFSANLGLGISVTPNAYEAGAYQKLVTDLYGSMIMIPLIMIASLGLAGAIDTIKILIWPPKEPQNLTKAFFKSVKKHFGLLLIPSIVVAILVGLLQFSLNAYALNRNWLDIVTIVLAAILLLFVVMVTMFYVAQGAAYKQRTFDRLKNSVVLSLINPHINALAAAASIAPIVLFAIYESIMFVALIFFVFMGFFYIMGVWLVYAHGVFDRYLNAQPVKVLAPAKKAAVKK